MRKTCPAKLTNRRPVYIREVANGYWCGCIIPDEDAPAGGAPADVLKFCDFTDHRGDPCEDDGYKPVAFNHEWMTPDEAIQRGMVYTTVAMEFFRRHNFDIIMQDKKLYEKFKKLGEV